MTKEELKNFISVMLPGSSTDDAGEWLNLSIDSGQWLTLANQLSQDPALKFDSLFCVTAVDWKTHLSMVYHLSSTTHNHILVVKAKIADRENAGIASVSHIWKTADFHELEAYDLMGIKFENHPGLRRLFLTDDFKGWPLRKDFEDPINMIEL